MDWDYLQQNVSSKEFTEILLNNIKELETENDAQKFDIEELEDEVLCLQDQLSNPWMDLRGTAAYSSLSISTLNRAVTSGQLKTSRVTGKLLFRKDWVDGWLNG